MKNTNNTGNCSQATAHRHINSDYNVIRCRQGPRQHSKSEPSRRPQQLTRAHLWPSNLVTLMYVRRPITSKSHTSTCTSATISTLRTKVVSTDLLRLYLSYLHFLVFIQMAVLFFLISQKNM